MAEGIEPSDRLRAPGAGDKPAIDKQNRPVQFSFISMNWRGRPLISIHTITELIAATTNQTGLSVQANYDPNYYATGIKITDTQMCALPFTQHDWHGDWNYTLTPAQIRRAIKPAASP